MNYIICFWDKSKIQVNEIIGEKLKQAIKENKLTHFELGDSLYMISGIEKIIPKDEAYICYPDEWGQLNQMEDRRPTEETLKKLTTKFKYQPNHLLEKLKK